MTRRLRVLYAVLFTLAVLVTLGGWLAGRDPSSLTGVLGTLAVAVGIGEASNVGKRATFKREACEMLEGQDG